MFAFIVVLIFMNNNVVQANVKEILMSDLEEENRIKKPLLLSSSEQERIEWISDEGFLSRGFHEEPSDPIVSLLRYLESLDSYTRHFYYAFGGIAFITVILSIWSLVSHRGFMKLEKLRSEVDRLETKNEKHKRFADILEQIQEDIKEINRNGNAARMDARKSEEKYRELSDKKLKSVVGDLNRVEQTISDIASTLNDAITHSKGTIKYFDVKLDGISEIYDSKLLDINETLRNLVTETRKITARAMQVTCSGETWE